MPVRGAYTVPEVEFRNPGRSREVRHGEPAAGPIADPRALRTRPVDALRFADDRPRSATGRLGQGELAEGALREFGGEHPVPAALRGIELVDRAQDLDRSFPP